MLATIDSIMAKEEKDEKYEHIKKYEKRAKEAGNIVTHIDLTHMETYAKAAKKVLKVEKDNVEDIRQKDLSKLKETKFQEKLADEMADLYKNNAKEYFRLTKEKEGKDWELDRFDEALLTRAVYGTTRAELKHLIADAKDKFTPTTFMNEHRPEFMKMVSHDLKAAAAQHLKPEHIEDIVKYTKIDKLHDVDPALVKLPEAINYLEIHRQLGAVPKDNIPDYHKKKKDKKEKKEPEEEPEEKPKKKKKSGKKEESDEEESEEETSKAA